MNAGEVTKRILSSIALGAIFFLVALIITLLTVGLSFPPSYVQSGIVMFATGVGIVLGVFAPAVTARAWDLLMFFSSGSGES